MPTDRVVIKSLPALRVAELTGTIRSFDPGEMGPVVASLLAEVLPTVQALARWLGANGYPFTAQHARERALARPEDPAEWLTELQVPISPRVSAA